MATYGKKKKGLLPSFSVFQDEKQERDPNQPPYSKGRLGKAMSKRQRSQSRGRLDESSGDELADTAILYNVPHELARLPHSYSLGAIAPSDSTRPKSSRSTKAFGDGADKPLPPVPSRSSVDDQIQRHKDRSVLAKKTANLKAINTKVGPADKPLISPPMLQDTTNTSIAISELIRPNTAHTTQNVVAPQTSTSEAENLSRKISTLMAQAAAQEEQTQSKAEAYAATSIKASPLARGKTALAKATRAIRERLSNGNIDRLPKQKRPVANRHSSFQGTGSGFHPRTTWQYELLDGMSCEKLDRRIAEGENLSNPKIKSMTGECNIPRKPLPVYESMKSRTMRSELTENPFSDEKRAPRFLPREDYSGFNFDFSKHNNEEMAEIAGTSTVVGHEQDEEPLEEPSQQTDLPESTPSFSNKISGLAQHPDVMCFTSSPLAQSTPRVRLEPQINGDAEDQAGSSLDGSVPARVPYRDDMDGDVSMEDCLPEGHPARLSDGSSLSVKRKSATEDLRAQVTPNTKKVKTDSTGSKEDLGLESEINSLDAEIGRVPLSPLDANPKVGELPQKAGKRRGLSIFDVSKGKGSANKDVEEGHSRSRSSSIAAGKKSSNSRPGSSFFHRARNSRSSAYQLVQSDEDNMDIDELQMNDDKYQIGAGKR